jgi:hypothetical protein
VGDFVEEDSDGGGETQFGAEGEGCTDGETVDKVVEGVTEEDQDGDGADGFDFFPECEFVGSVGMASVRVGVDMWVGVLVAFGVVH